MRLYLLPLIAMLLLSACAGRNNDFANLEETEAQQLILSGSGVLWENEKDKINSNITELYGKVIASAALSGTNLVITLDDTTTITAPLAGLQDGTGTDDQQISALSFNDSNNILTVTIEGGNTATVDLSPLASAGGLTDAPSDGTTYGRNNGAWVAISGGGDMLAANNLSEVDPASARTNLGVPATGDVPTNNNQLTNGAGYLTQTAANAFYSLLTHNHAGVYQPLHANLTSIANGIYLGIINDAGTDANTIWSAFKIDAEITAALAGGGSGCTVGSAVPARNDAGSDGDCMWYAGTMYQYDTDHWERAWSSIDDLTGVFDLTMAITDATGTNSTFTVNSEAATVADTPKTWTGLNSATQAVTFAPNSTETSSCAGTGVTGSDPNWVVDMSSADVTDMACTVSAAGGGCASGTVDPSADFAGAAAGNNNVKLYSTLSYGQSFQVSQAGTVRAIRIRTGFVENGGGNVTLRWGPGPDLTTTYYDEVTVNITTASP